MTMTRRDFLTTSMVGAGALGVSRSLFPSWMPRLAFRSPDVMAERDVLLCIFLRGGMDGLCAVAPFGEGSAYYDRRPTQHLNEPGSGGTAAIDLDGFFGLHPALSPLKEIYDEGDMAVVHATGLTDPSRSHFDAMLYMEYGTPGSKASDSGWLARHLRTAAWQNDSPFRAVGLGDTLPTSLVGSSAPMALKSIADFHLRGRQGEVVRMQRALRQLYHVDSPSDATENQARLVFEAVEMLEAINPGTYEAANGAAYPNDEYGFGRGLQQVAQLIKAEVGLEVACVDLGGWDTHENQGTGQGEFASLMNLLGRGLGAFYTDLADHMANISVITMSEFGRTVSENASAGTDHGHGNVMFLMGGGVNGGQVFVEWPTLSRDALAQADGDLPITTDYRDVIAAVLANRVMNPATDAIFPDHTVTPLDVVTRRA
jgi:uncharacterized protein (DUF1501 family)